ncbi:MAG: glucosamine-6-phosphate deaminase [Actinomycetaceae bacterium]|nr:glucosamine-6-phosphate deaminase [Actinomycetaceae bacterium]
MKVIIASNEADIARMVADDIQSVFAAKPDGVLGLATGSSPLAVYDELGTRVASGALSLAQAKAFQLDEYVGLPQGHEQTYRYVINDIFASKVDIDPANVHVPNGAAADPAQAAIDYEQAIMQAGGVDYQILGIGSDGHIAFNEPGGSLSSRTHVGGLTAQSRQDNARFFDGDISRVPTHCITQGLETIMAARQIGMVILGAGKAQAARELVEGAVSARWPATILQFHPNASVYLDEEAASQLELIDFYREVGVQGN